jgi:hypothetical protein
MFIPISFSGERRKKDIGSRAIAKIRRLLQRIGELPSKISIKWLRKTASFLPFRPYFMYIYSWMYCPRQTLRRFTPGIFSRLSIFTAHEHVPSDFRLVHFIQQAREIKTRPRNRCQVKQIHVDCYIIGIFAKLRFTFWSIRNSYYINCYFEFCCLNY